MKNNKKSATVFGYTVPHGYALCLQSNCSLCNKCTHYLAASADGLDEMETVIMPSARNDGACRYYKEKRIVSGAWGFSNMMRCVKSEDVRAMRSQLISVIGSQPSFYRYKRGEAMLSPERQKEILSVFNSFGYDGLAFDSYASVVDW